VSDIVAPWVSHCFIGALGCSNLEATARIWDSLVYEGAKVLHRTGVALLGLCECTVASCGNAAALPQLIESRCAQTLGLPGSEGLLVAAAFRRSAVGGMPGAQLERMRDAAAVEVERRLERRRRQLELILSH